MKFSLGVVVAAAWAAQTAALAVGGQHLMVKKGSDGLQDIVTYDEHSIMIHGERIYIFSGEFHPYRLPVTDLFLDVFQKIKALGFSAVSFYTDWALLEGQQGVYNASGIFALEPFFEAAQEAGIYLIARPGPYVNAESAGGGFPGWLQRVKGQLRTRAPDYLASTDNYAAHVGATIAKYQITNGGPIILVQPENEYTVESGIDTPFPDPVYMAYVEKQLRDAGIIVPFVLNDASPKGYFAPGHTINGSTLGDVDIYGYDSYPLGFNCASPYTWGKNSLPTNFFQLHEQQSPSTYNAIEEFQGGSFDPWGGLGFDQCAILLNMEFERVFYKNNFAAGVSQLSLYMIFGGTNWGNLGHSGGYTSYDYGASITENRLLVREKYSELKLEGNFIKVTPQILVATPGTLTDSTYATPSTISVTPLNIANSTTKLYVVRHTDYQQTTASNYTMKLTTSHGNLVIPQLGGVLTLSGRDSKWAVTDYPIGSATILYSTAEIFTWQQYSTKSVVVVYGGPGEHHEMALISTATPVIIEGTGVTSQIKNGSSILNWQTSPSRRVVSIGGTIIYIVDRNTAYNFWVPTFSRSDVWGNYSANIGNTTAVVVEAGYLIRSAHMEGNALYIEGDLNATAPLNILGAPAVPKSLHFNGKQLNFTTNAQSGELSSTLTYDRPCLTLPDLSTASWKYLNDLPEITPSYDDSLWTNANLTTSVNPRKLTTPTDLYASDYGYNTGTLVYRGHFVATGAETTFNVYTQGGDGFGSSVFLNGTFIGSWKGADYAEGHNDTYTLPNLVAGKPYVFTVVVDNNGLDENYDVGQDQMKTPRGVLDYHLAGRPQSALTWKLTGNLGGEMYVDKARGPLNEGGLYAERQGFTQPKPPSANWAAGNPNTGIAGAGVALYTTSFTLDLPRQYDIPLTFNFGNTTINGTTSNYLAILYCNGYQFGKYINNVGPQKSFPVPQGILDFYGTNYVAVELWARDARGAHLTNFTLAAGVPVLTSMKAPGLSPMPAYSPRPGAY